MPKFKEYPKEDLIGKTFGFLTVTKFSEYKHSKSRRYPYWYAECICGNIVERESSILKRKNEHSCGCKRNKDFPDNDLTGKTFGKLTVTSFAGYKLYGKNKIKCAFFNVKCSCNSAEFSILGSKLTRNKNSQVSCGCYRKEQAKNKIKEIKNNITDDYAGMLLLYSIYKSRAIKRGYTFDVSVEDFYKITSSNCFYCGVSPLQTYKPKKRNNSYYYNGIDRIDNFKGYEYGNLNPCCKTCNYAKKDLTEEKFKEWLNRLIKYQLKLKNAN